MIRDSLTYGAGEVLQPQQHFQISW